MVTKKSDTKKITRVTASASPSKILLKSLRGKHIKIKLSEDSPT